MNTAALRIPPTTAAAPAAAVAGSEARQLEAAYARLQAHFPLLSQKDICGDRATIADLIGDLATEYLPDAIRTKARQLDTDLWSMFDRLRSELELTCRVQLERHRAEDIIRTVAMCLEFVRKCAGCGRPVACSEELCPACQAELDHDDDDRHWSHR